MSVCKLCEQVEIDKVRTLWHASHVGNLEDIRKYGVLPIHGEIVQGTEAYQTMNDPEYEDWEEELQEVAFFSPEGPHFINWQVGNHIKKNMHEVTLSELQQYGLVAGFSPKLHADEIYCMHTDHKAMRLDGEDEIWDVPPHVESVDCFSLEPVSADYILTGEKMMKYLNSKFPDIIQQTKQNEEKLAAKQQAQKEALEKKIGRLKYLSGI